MAKGFKTPGSGRKVGTRNKAKTEAEERARLEHERLAELEAAAKNAGAKLAAATATGKKLMKEILFDGAQLAMGLAVYFAPHAQWYVKDGKKVNANENYNEEQFRFYMGMAREFAHAGAPFQSPRYSAMVVGATVVTKVKVEGGMPDDWEPPAPGRVEFAPGTIVTAEDENGAKVIDLVPNKAVG